MCIQTTSIIILATSMKILASHGPVGMHRILGKTQGFVVLFVFAMVSRSLGKNASDTSAYLYLFENVDICVFVYLYLLVFLKWTADLLDTPVSVSAPTNPPISSAMLMVIRLLARKSPTLHPR